MESFKLFVFFLITILSLISCAPSISFTGKFSKKIQKQKDYKILYIDEGDRISDSTIVLGEINVYDGGLAVNCGFAEVINKLEEEARKVGADAIKITELKPPDSFSTCFRIKAEAYDYLGSDTNKVTLAQILAPLDILDSAFISYNDCVECKEYGKVDEISKDKNQIITVPIGIITSLNDGGNSFNNYPITESRMNEQFNLLLESYGWNVKPLSRESIYYNSLVDYYSSILQHLLNDNENPLEWKVDSLLQINEPNSYLYFPIIIEREAQYIMKARFYLVITNNIGQIINFSCFNFDPKLWSRDFNKFANDIENRLPLTRE